MIIKNIAIKNFMSIGNVTQSISFVDKDLVLVLGENLDQGGNDARNGVGKAQPLYSKILTPKGWTTMGDVQVGDTILAANGTETRITHIFPQGKKKTYRIYFNDGRYTDACEDHLWKIYSHSFRTTSDDLFKTLTTKELIEHTDKYKNHKNKSTYYKYVPLLIPPVQDDIDLPLDPYFLGAMLGDGCLSAKTGIGFTTADYAIFENISKCLPDNISISPSRHSKYRYNFIQKVRKQKSILTESLKKLGLYGALSHTKFIPDSYKIASTKQKIHLLQGLVDTDGYVGGQGCLSISTVSEKMAKDIQELVWSIGGIAHISKKTNCGYKKDKEFIKCKDAYNVSIMYHTPKALSRLPRKQNRLPGENYQYKNRKLRIEKIELLGQIESQCIMIDDPSHLYITDNYIVTHNSTIINALSYAFFGTALTNIRRDNLINKTNGKNMVVTLEFEKDGVEYLIERSRRPNKFSLMIAGTEASVDEADEAQGENRHTQQQLERVIGLSHAMFKNIVALNTYSQPFLAMGANDQRALIEQLLGITKLSEKADVLKELLKQTKESLKEEEFRIEAIKVANKRIENNIDSLKIKSAAWDKNQTALLEETQEAITVLEGIDIEQEITNQRILASIKENRQKKDAIENEYKSVKRTIVSLENSLKKQQENLVKLEEQSCYTCGQDLQDDAHERIEKETVERIAEIEESLKDKRPKLEELEERRDAITIEESPDTFYDDLESAYDHRSSLESLQSTLNSESERTNHFIEQIESLEKTGLQTIDYTKMNDLSSLRDHQEFLFKLLTNKDSFIRRKIINQNLTHLNARLEYYLNRIGLPHTVKFQSDLGVEIQEHGRDLDFDNLSRGERTRLILGLSWAFRDVYESLNASINLLFIDELIDSGLDTAGVESALAVLKQMGREAQRNIFLISHRDDLIGRVGSVLKVVKESGFTSFENDADLA